MKLKLFPYPVRVEIYDGYYCGGIKTAAEDPLSDFINKNNGKYIVYKNDLSVKPEGYFLEVTEKRVTVTSSDFRGALYGGLTVYKLYKLYNGKIPCLKIEDYPRVKARGVQVCFGQFDVGWNADRMKRLLKDFALSGINEVYLYLEWNFRLADIPFLPETGISESDMKEFVAYAKRYGITVIPQVNLLGHSKEILDLEIMREYKEGDYTFCPSNEKTLELAYRITDALCDIFPSPVIHVGGDEVGAYGVCDLCRKKREQGGALNIFFEYFGKIAKRLGSRGRKAGLWSDQILKLQKDSRFWINTDQELNFYEDNVKRLKSIAENIVVYDWWYEGEYDESADFFRSLGVVYYACASTNGYVSSGADLNQMNNIYNLYAYAERAGASGELITDWMNVNGFVAEHCLLLIAAGAVLGWCGAENGFTKNQSYSEFLRYASEVYYGNEKVCYYMFYTGTDGELLSGLPEKCRGLTLRNDMFFQINPVFLYVAFGKEISEYSDFEKRISYAEKLYDKAGKTEFLDLPIIATRFILKKVAVMQEAFGYYNLAAKAQFYNKKEFEQNLCRCAEKLKGFLPQYDAPEKYIKNIYGKTGGDNLTYKRLLEQKKNLLRLIKYLGSDDIKKFPLPSVENLSEHFFSPFTDELFGTLTLNWQKQGKYSTASDYRKGYFYSPIKAQKIRNDYDE